MNNVTFVQDTHAWETALPRDWHIEGATNVREIDNATVLPLRKIKGMKVADAAYMGGVVDDRGRFVAGHLRMAHREEDANIWALNRACDRGYEFDSASVNHLDESVIYGGVIHSHFGHFILESLSRLWYVVAHPEDTRRIVFNYYGTLHDFATTILDILGISDRCIFVAPASVDATPMSFAHIMVPDQSAYCFSGYHGEYTSVYDILRTRASTSSEYAKKVYLTRTKMTRKLTIGEPYFEDWFAQRGYEVVAPETLPLRDQIALVANAQEIACISGTLSHLLLFAPSGVRLTALNRTENIVKPQMMIDQARDIDATHVDVGCSWLPYGDGHGCWMVGPTRYWSEYLASQGEAPANITLEEHRAHYAYAYAREWAHMYAERGSYKSLRNTTDSFDLVNLMHTELLGESLDRQTYEKRSHPAEMEAQIKALKAKNKQLSAENKKLSSKLSKMKSSRSWKITAPLRRLSR